MSESSGDLIAGQKKKYKKRMKKMCYCGLGWLFIGILIFVTAIALLVSFSQYWNDNNDWRRGLAFTGVALLLLGLVMATIGICFCFVLYMFYKRLSGDSSGEPHFKPPVYEYGKAPYPQQPTTGYSNVSSGDPNNSNLGPSAPPSHDQQGVNVDVSNNTKF